MNYTATYSPDDNKLRLYASARLPQDLYERVKSAGFRWAPKQECFYTPQWTPQAADLLEELAGQIDDDDKTLTERAEERADRFEQYQENRANDATSAADAVKRLADGIPLGQPILIGHHSEKHARRDAEKIENGMRRAVKMWETSEYWKYRAAGAIRHAKYKERPDVRARRIKGIEADARKIARTDKESAASLRMLDAIDQPEKWKPRADGTTLTREERAAYIAARLHANLSRKNETGSYWSIYDVLRLPIEERYKAAPVMTIDEVLTDVRASFARATAYRQRWAAHYAMRLEYERAMLAEAGGTVADRTAPEVGGAVRSLWGPRAGWAYIVKVNRVTVTIRHQWNEGGRVFAHNEPLDKLNAIMSRAQVDEARAQGRIKESPEGIGFWLMQSREEFDRDNGPAPEPTTPAPEPTRAPAPVAAAPTGDLFDAMRESLRAGVQVVAAPQLFPTPPELAARMVELADIPPGARVLEPSAGTGNLIRAMLKGQDDGLQVVAVEINGALAMQLSTNGLAGDVTEGDFLKLNGDLGTFDRIVMNPPFQNAADIAHILHARAMLKEGGRLVAICANGPRQREQLQPLAVHWEDLPAGTFKEAGTGVNAALLILDHAGA